MRDVAARFGALADRYESSLGALLVISGFFGFILGIATATWQAPIEAAQVLMGSVPYDHSSPVYSMHVAIFSLVNYLLWFFLAVTNSEVASSILLSAVLGVVAVQSLAMVIFIGVRNVYVAVLSALPAIPIHLFGYGIAYPIIFLGTTHAFGRAGFFFALWGFLFFVFGRYRTAFLICGLTLGVHPSWGLWVGLCLLGVLATGFGYLKPLVNRANVLAYFAGVAISAAFILWHKMAFPLPAQDAAQNADAGRELFLNYIRYWDFHRQRFDNPNNLIREFTYAAIALALSIYMFVRREARLSEKLFAHLMIVTTLLGLVFVFVPSWFAPEAFPGALIALMPGRFINIPLFVALPLLLGFFLRGKKTLQSLVAATILWAGLMFFSRYSPTPLPLGQREFSLILAYLLSYLYYRRFAHRNAGQSSYSLTNRVLGALAVALILLSPAFLAYRMPVLRKNFARIQIPSDIRGRVLTTTDKYLLQIEARVPTITPLLDGYAHSGTQSLLWVNSMMGDIYGIPLSASPPPLKRFNAGVIETQEFQKLWESRSCNDWQQLAGKYGFGLILVPASVSLQLPEVDNDPLWNKYRPVCAVGAGPA